MKSGDFFVHSLCLTLLSITKHQHHTLAYQIIRFELDTFIRYTGVCLLAYLPTYMRCTYFDCFFSIIRLNIKIVHRPLSRYHQFEFIMYNELMIQIFSNIRCVRGGLFKFIYYYNNGTHSHTDCSIEGCDF